jgi:hypothetical protein
MTKEFALIQKQQLAKLRELEAMWDDLARNILGNAGWTYHSNYPDSCWRYAKTFKKGGQITCDPHEAIRITEMLNARAVEAIGYGEEPGDE